MFPESPLVTGGASGLELRILGPVEAVSAGREIALGGPKQRAVLALLLLDVGRVVPAGRLVEEVWRGSAPPGAAKTLRSYVSRLRAALGPDVSVVARGGGYAITVEANQLDAARFERLIAAGHDALGQGEAAAASNRFREALGLWRGRALADVMDVELLALEGSRLEELRLVALEGRIEADLALGLHPEAAGELERLVVQYPLRERLWRLLVLALYRSERQADALAAYRRARTLLADELGLEPGEDLRMLEEAVLRQDVPAATPRPQRHNLPAQLTGLLGRERELARLEKLIDEARLVTLTGTGGVGKTRLVLALAAAALDQFPDGAWLTDLAGIADPELVPSLVLEALGVRQSGGMLLIEALRYRLRTAELLLVLDNCEHVLSACAELASDLLRGSPGLRVLTTSREPLGIAGEAVYVVPPLAVPAEQAGTEALAHAPAVQLFFERASALHGGAGLAATTIAAAARICRELDGLPLAIELAAARTTALSVEEIEVHLADRFRLLAYRRPTADPRHQALKAAIDWSYDLLPSEEQRAFQQLSVFAGGFRLKEAAAVCCDGDEPAALDIIDRLTSKSLTIAEMVAGGTRYRMLETVRQYAAGRLAVDGEADQASDRHAVAFLQFAEREHDLAALSRDHDNFRAALDHTLSRTGEAGPQLASALGSFWLARGFLQESQSWLERALAAGQAGRHLRADLLRLLGTALYHTGDLERAEVVLSEGSQVAAAAGLLRVQARIRVLLADIHMSRGGLSSEALEECETAAALLESEGDAEGLAEAWLEIGKLRMWLGYSSQEAFERAINYARQGANYRPEVESMSWLLAYFQYLPIPADVAIGRGEQFLEAASGDPWAQAAVLLPLSLLYGRAGRFADARAAITHGQSLYSGLGAKYIPGALLSRRHRADGRGPPQGRGGTEEGMRSAARDGRTRISLLLPSQARRGSLRAGAPIRGTTADGGSPGASCGRGPRRSGPVADHASEAARPPRPFAAARQLAHEAQALISPTPWAMLQAKILVAKAEVNRLAGARDQATANLRAALRILDDRREVPLAKQAKAALASLVPHRSKPA